MWWRFSSSVYFFELDLWSIFLIQNVYIPGGISFSGMNDTSDDIPGIGQYEDFHTIDWQRDIARDRMRHRYIIKKRQNSICDLIKVWLIIWISVFAVTNKRNLWIFVSFRVPTTPGPAGYAYSLLVYVPDALLASLILAVAGWQTSNSAYAHKRFGWIASSVVGRLVRRRSIVKIVRNGERGPRF